MSTLQDREAEARSSRASRAAGDRWRAVEERIEFDILSFVKKHPGATADDLRRNVTGQATTVDRVRRRLMDEGKLREMRGYQLGGRS